MIDKNGGKYMKRSEIHKSIKLYKRRCRSVLFMSTILTIAGIIVADYSINSLMGSSKRINVISFENKDSEFELNIMNYKVYPDSGLIAKLTEQMKNILN